MIGCIREDAALDLTDEQWVVLEPLIGELPRWADGRGRRGRPWRRSREVMDGILWILRTGAQWHELPARYPPYQTCHRRFQRWVRDGALERVLEVLARARKERGKLNLSECFIDATFIVAKTGRVRGSDQAGQRFKAHGSGGPRWSSARRLCRLGLARAQVSLVAATLDSRFVDDLPRRLIGDRAYDADPLDEALLEWDPLESTCRHASLSIL